MLATDCKKTQKIETWSDIFNDRRKFAKTLNVTVQGSYVLITLNIKSLLKKHCFVANSDFLSQDTHHKMYN